MSWLDYTHRELSVVASAKISIGRKSRSRSKMMGSFWETMLTAFASRPQVRLSDATLLNPKLSDPKPSDPNCPILRFRTGPGSEPVSACAILDNFD